MVGLPLGLAPGPGRAEDRGGRCRAARQRSWIPNSTAGSSALAYASVRMLGALGVWEGLAAHAQPIRDILVTDGQPGKPASPFSLHFDAAGSRRRRRWAISPRTVTSAPRCLRRRMRAPNLELIAPAAVTRL